MTRKIETLVLNTQKNSYLNQATQKNTCQNFSSPKNSSIIPITRNPEYPPPPRAKAQYPHTNSPDSSSYVSKKKKIREFNKISKYFLFADHFINSHIHFSWQCMEIVKRKLTLVTVRVLKPPFGGRLDKWRMLPCCERRTKDNIKHTHGSIKSVTRKSSNFSCLVYN